MKVWIRASKSIESNFQRATTTSNLSVDAKEVATKEKLRKWKYLKVYVRKYAKMTNWK